MDIVYCLTSSWLSRLAYTHYQNQPPHQQAVSTPRSVVFWALFLFQYLVVKFYRIVIHPRYVSSLRHLPGPKVIYLMFTLPYSS